MDLINEKNILILEQTAIIRSIHAENQVLKLRIEKLEKVRDDVVNLIDDLFAERRECIKLEDTIESLKASMYDKPRND